MALEEAPTLKSKAETLQEKIETPKTKVDKPVAKPQQDDDLTTKLLTFLSTATPETLGAIAVCLAAVTYFILGQIGLVIIGAFAGVTLHSSWEARHPDVSLRRERGYDILDRLVKTRTQASSIKSEEDQENEIQTLSRNFDDFQPETREALNALVDAVVRDYVEWWYGPILPKDKSFPLSCRKVLTNFLLSISNHLCRKRPADAFVDFLTHTCSIIIVFFTEMTAAYAVLPTVDSSTTAADAIYNYLASHTDSPLSNLLNQREQTGKFKMVAEDLLSYLERSTYDCDPARVFLREILATIILEGTLQTCSKPEWINAWIVYLLESGETDLSQAIDEAIQDQKAFADVDGNFGNISLSKGNRNSYEMDRARKKEIAHKKKLSKADEEMEQAMEEMKKLNEMIAKAEKAKPKEGSKDEESAASGLINNGVKRNAKELDLKTNASSVANTVSAPSIPKGNPSKIESATDLLISPMSSELATTEATLRSNVDLTNPVPSPCPAKESAASSRFTNFDQIVPPAKDEPDEEEIRRLQPLTLHNATITIHDDPGNEKGRLRSKPSWEYLIQIEPASSQHPGWMVMKTYVQFESLHESVRRIAAVSGATAFMEAHANFPGWKTHTRSSLRGEIERYMRMACSEKSLAESEAMKKFLEKGQETRMGNNRGFSFESMGKGMLDAIQNAPKGAFDGGKVMVGGVTGVFGNIGLGPRKSTNSSIQEAQVPKTSSIPSSRPQSTSFLPRMDASASMSRDSLDSQRSSIIATQPGKIAPMERRSSYQMDFEADGPQNTRADNWERKSLSTASSRVNSRASSMAALRSPLRSPSEMSLSHLKLPPPPNEISDDYGSPVATRRSCDGPWKNDGLLSPHSPHTSFTSSSPSRSPEYQQSEKAAQSNGIASVRRPQKQHPPLSEQETRVAVELLFAVINELYALSSAWNIRRTLLTAAKTFLIRPGNPSLVSIQSLIQESVLDANISDEGMAAHLRKLRENSLPTEEERKTWPAELTTEEKEELRVKARKLFIQSSVPAALIGIMGQSATGEALGRLFDCLQIEEVARGLFFGIMLQAVRIITH
ncbi:PXA domain-containing protein [Pseudomassariella vexata]|uniref:PXA domain-domain-containing protein n=1 Tax=Pseudomassariella vexata TaxID=1141098 RepID=A0A1Y2DDI0_9PEZI|nr:PXA domain-containing protein [Pseudomassariella vexata]ORY57299.1 PXA domain-domain-containing protein [Pseudomassariella vexata]